MTLLRAESEENSARTNLFTLIIVSHSKRWILSCEAINGFRELCNIVLKKRKVPKKVLVLSLSFTQCCGERKIRQTTINAINWRYFGISVDINLALTLKFVNETL